MGRFSNFCLIFIIILIVSLEVLGKKRKQKSADCGKCGRRMPALEGLRGSERIINGRQVKPPFKYPWIVKVEAHRTCSGSSISKKYVLTSAYCLTKSESKSGPKCKKGKLPKECYVQNSDVKLRVPWKDSTKFRKTLQVEKLFPHPDYEHPSENHDIALIQISRDNECTSFYQPICLPTEDLNKFGDTLITTGWGQNTPDGDTNGAKVLREAEMKQVKFSYCENISAANSSNDICVMGTTEAQMPCKGDSGGSIFTDFQKAYYALGIISLPEEDPPRCQPSKPVTFTKVHGYIDWIKKYEKQFPEPYKHYVKIEDLESDEEPAES